MLKREWEYTSIGKLIKEFQGLGIELIELQRSCLIA